MKTSIHPHYFDEAQIRCACGNVLTVGSTLEELPVELCSQCHPFYTGKQKLIDTAGRVERFKKKVERKDAAAATRKGKKVKRATTSARRLVKQKDAA